MNILYLNHYAGTPALGMEFRPYYLAREWVRLGHRVQIVAADFSHVRSRQPAAGAEVVDGIHYRWLPTPPYTGNGMGRMRNILAYLQALWAEAPAWAHGFRPDAVIASSTYPLDIWPAQRIAKLARAKLVHEVHDLWPLSPIELSGMSPWHPFALVCQSAENTACRSADAVVSMLPKVHEHMARHGLDLDKLHIVPNGITLDEWQGTPPALDAAVAEAITTARLDKRVVVGYAGSMGEPNALDTLLDAAALLRDEPFAFVLVGSGHRREHLAARIQREGLAQVHLLPPIPKAQVPAFLARVHMAWIGWQRVPIYRFGIAPNKLMDYMMARCPVVHAVQAGNDPVAEAQCGFTVRPQDAAASADGLRRLAALPAAMRKAMGERGRSFVLQHHTYPVLAQRFLEALA
jgi:glycosyltransferase involved in cell wall biosynthesis